MMHLEEPRRNEVYGACGVGWLGLSEGVSEGAQWRGTPSRTTPLWDADMGNRIVETETGVRDLDRDGDRDGDGNKH